MIPFKLTKEQFVMKYRSLLDRESPRLITILRDLFNQPLSDDIASAEVHIFVESDGYALPSVWIYFSGNNNKIDSSDPTLFSSRSLEIVRSINRLNTFDSRFFSNEDYGGLDLAANVLKAWFAECWWKAGGWDYCCPVMLSVHDDFGDGHNVRLTEATIRE